MRAFSTRSSFLRTKGFEEAVAIEHDVIRAVVGRDVFAVARLPSLSAPAFCPRAKIGKDKQSVDRLHQRRPWAHPHYIDPLVDPWLRVKTLLTTAIGGTGNNTTASSWPLKIALHPWRSIPVIPQPFLWLCQHLPPLSDAPSDPDAARAQSLDKTSAEDNRARHSLFFVPWPRPPSAYPLDILSRPLLRIPQSSTFLSPCDSPANLLLGQSLISHFTSSNKNNKFWSGAERVNNLQDISFRVLLRRLGPSVTSSVSGATALNAAAA
ncbi:hypothetical protein KCU85_g406, partial [Aureobasidium melanogenum]